MMICKTIASLTQQLQQQRTKGARIGFIPTMGALHEGHLSLIDAGKRDNTLTVCSIFVNPTQFNDKKDYEKYPVTLDNDIYLLEKRGCDVLFLPSANEIYPAGTELRSKYELGFLETILEGKFRPGHFQGVCQVVHRLLDIVEPDDLYLGQKDYQQCMVISKLVELIGKKDKISLHVCSTLRESHGLAMSSRNMRLSDQARSNASIIFKTLDSIKKHLIKGDISHLANQAVNALEHKGLRVDYFEIADARTLEPVKNWDGQQQLVALTAAFLEEVRLIDNLTLN